jgi:hypothetical protein
MPLAFVEHWSKLSNLADRLADLREELSRIAFLGPIALIPASANGLASFQPKNDDDYRALIRGGLQMRSRTHERLVRMAAMWLQQKGAVVSNPHPIDLMLTSPFKMIIEAKVVRGDNPIFAVREAVGQLHEYRYFLNLRDSPLCILLSAPPDASLVKYVEEELAMMLIWSEGEQFAQGPRTAERLTITQQ